MKKPELLSPAGDFECLQAAIEAGCDAVYLGGKLFGARAFSKNFSDEEMMKAIQYAHLYGVKVYVTMNTLVYEKEVERFLNYVDFLYRSNVDAIIIQDIGMMDLIRKTYPTLELHASTQMHIHNLEGVKLLESLGLKRAVLARETEIDTIKKIKDNTDMALEIFVHGALCVSYSGQCLMSSLIGNRSGNRGSCAGSCRQKYNLLADGKKINKEEYLLSMKDLNSLENIGMLIEIGIDSLKIEGRMKSAAYVYMVTHLYRKAIDSYYENKKVKIDSQEFLNLKKIFNREYTKGFLFKESNNEITNSYRPNHQGVKIGKVVDYKNGFIDIQLSDNLSLQDGIRFLEPDIGFMVTSMFKNKRRITEASKNDIISLPYKNKIAIGSTVVKTFDSCLTKELDIKRNPKKIKITGRLKALIEEPLYLEFSDGRNTVEIVGNTVEKSITQSISKTRIDEQIKKIGNSIYTLDSLEIVGDNDIFISIKELNDLKNKAVEKLNELRMYQIPYHKETYKVELPDYPHLHNYNIYLSTVKQYEEISSLPFDKIYVERDIYEKINDKRKVLKLERVMDIYPEYTKNLLVGELGSIYKYQNVDTDWSFNVTNSYSVAFLHSMGVKKITLSYELTDLQMKDIIDNYENRYHKHPNLEVISYGKEEAMISKFNLNKLYHVDFSYLQDRYRNLYPVITKGQLMKIYNYKPRNKKTNYFEMGVNSIRINWLDESEEIQELIKW